jgi:hypothetical protein
MSTFILTNPLPATHPAPAPRTRKGFFRPIAEFLDGIRLARAMAHRYDVLSAMSDAELARRGIKREDIPRIAVNGAR